MSATETESKHDEQYRLAQAMTAEFSRVLDLCEQINDRNAGASPWNEWGEIVERIIEEHIGSPLSIDADLESVPLDVLYGYGDTDDLPSYLKQINVVLGTGGPACGVNFRDGHAYAWHQDWFTPRVEDVNPISNAEILASHWGIEDY